jgi:hypothetical protein
MPSLSVDLGLNLAVLRSWKQNQDIQRLLDSVAGYETEPRLKCRFYQMDPLSGHVQYDNETLGSTRLFRQ